MSEPERLEVVPPRARARAVGRAMWMMEEARRRTMEALEDLPPALLDARPAGTPYSIGTILYHVAMIEADWLYFEVLEADHFPAEVQALFPFEIRNEKGELSPVTGLSLEEHLARLAAVRERLLRTFREMSAADFVRLRMLDEYLVSPEWVLYHLCEHEDVHRGHIQLIRWLASPSDGTKPG